MVRLLVLSPSKNGDVSHTVDLIAGNHRAMVAQFAQTFLNVNVAVIREDCGSDAPRTIL
jgi:hypothetical protein